MKKHQLFATDSVIIPKINSVGFSDDPQVTFFGPSVRNQYIIHYVLSGKGSFNGHAVKKGEGFLITPGMHQEYHPDRGDPWSFVWIISEDEAMQSFFDRHEANRESGIFKIHNLYGITAVADGLRDVWDGLSSSSELTELFLRCFHSAVSNDTARQSSITKIYFEFSVNYIKANLHLPLSVDGLCKTIGISQPYLYRIFKEEFGCSPKEYILKCKLSESKRLLSETDLSISRVSASVGFISALDFSKFFSKHTGHSPTAYRKSTSHREDY